MVKKLKKILLSGFSLQQINMFKKNYKKVNFINYNNLKNIKSGFDAFISINRKNFEKFYNSDYEKLKKSISWIHVAAAGLDKYPKLFEKNDYTLTNGKIIQGPEVADHAFALLLSLTRNLNVILKYGPNKKFSKRPIELQGKKILIVGYGGVGKCIAERAFGFGMKVSAINFYHTKKSKLVEKIYQRKSYFKALKDKDVILYSVPLTSKTKNLFNSKSAKNFKKGAILINICRGGVVCSKTLYKYLKNNYLGGAGVDALDSSDNLQNNSKFLKLKNFVFTPHIAGISDNLKFRNFKLIEDNLYHFVNNKRLINIVQREELK